MQLIYLPNHHGLPKIILLRLRLWRIILTGSFSMEEHIESVFHISGIYHFCSIYEEYLVCILDRIETMRDDNLRSRFRKLTEHLFEELFSDGIDIRCCFVEDEDLGLFEDGAHERK